MLRIINCHACRVTVAFENKDIQNGGMWCIASYLCACGMSLTDGCFERPCWRHAGPAHRTAAKVHSALALLQICRHTAVKLRASPVSSEIHPAVSKRPHLCKNSIMCHLQPTTQAVLALRRAAKSVTGRQMICILGTTSLLQLSKLGFSRIFKPVIL